MRTSNSTIFSHSPNLPEALDLLSRIMAAECHFYPRNVDRPLALYGAGDLGRMAKQYFDFLEIPVAFVVDTKSEQIKSDLFWSGINVISPENVDPKTRESVLLAVCVVNSPYTELARSLNVAGWADVVPFYDIAETYRDRHPLSNGWFAAPFSSTDINNIELALDGWADDVSRAHHLQFIAWRRLREEWIFTGAPVITNNRFFIPELLAVLTDHEAFADLGAHIGGVSRCFIEAVNSHFREIWVIEPDPMNLSNLRLMISNLLEASKIKIIPAVLGSERGKRNYFQGLGYASQCSDLVQNEQEVKTVDALGLSPTFLKLHLEGAELDALKGARKTIHQYRPIIAVTSYHNHDGLWELPQWLMEELSDYQFYMRLHSWCGTGAVIYAIPFERACGGTLNTGIASVEESNL